MTLVLEDSLQNVALVLWDGVELLDFAGPGEVFAAAHMGGTGAYNVYTVGLTKASIVSQGFVRVTPQYSIEDCPEPDIIVLPGGGTSIPRNDAKFMAWLKRSVPNTQATMSICTGAFILADAGLLDGQKATTWHNAIGALRREATETEVLANTRFVDNGRIITTAGVSAGIDGALHIVAREQGEEAAAETAKYMEYDWDRKRNPGLVAPEKEPTNGN
jgi:transcriptional regulator GlxA family with amidase domain